MRNLRLTHLALVVLLLALPSCNQSRKVVGKWKVVGGSTEMVWEFFENGRLSAAGVPGKYSFGDGQRIKIQTPAATFVHHLEIDGDRMIWKGLDGTRTEFVRVK